MDRSLRNELLAFAKENYGTEPDRPWKTNPENVILRHGDSRKWYALIFPVLRKNLSLPGAGEVDVLNVKCDPVAGFSLREIPGILPAYHMNHTEWISVLLDGTVPLEKILPLLDMSYSLTASKKKVEKFRGPKDWIFPANRKMYDVEHAFDGTDEIEWHYTNDIRIGDTIFIYLAAPVSAILFRCRVMELNLPCPFPTERHSFQKWLRVKLERRYDPGEFPFSVLKEYGVNAIRGPRGVPYGLGVALRRQG